MKQRRYTRDSLTTLTLLLPLLVSAAGQAPDLPPDEVVIRILRKAPSIEAAASNIQAEEANRRRLEAGSHEWNLRLGSQQMRSRTTDGSEQRFKEWTAGIERPIRLPGKATLDAELGAKGVDLAQTAHGDTLHETSRNLLKSWFVWLKESASASQWKAQAEVLGKQAQSVQRRQQLGDAARLEAIQAEAAKAQADAQLAQASVRQRSAEEDLRRRFPDLPLNAPAKLSDPTAISGPASEWINAILEHSHELALARGETQRAQIVASRSDRERLPDPTIGFQVLRERSGEDRIMGAYVSIPLPGDGRRAHSEVTQAYAMAANSQEAAALQKISAEAAILYHNAEAAFSTWQAGRNAAEHLSRAADMTARAYQLGEGTLTELLNSRRLAHEAVLTAQLLQLDALELRYRLLLDAHRLWEAD